MNASLRLLLGMAVLSIPAVGLQVLRPGWLQDARHELGVLRESRARVATEGERKERLVEATTSATARLAAKQRLVRDLVAEVTTLAEVARQFKALDAAVPDPSHSIGAPEYPGASEEERYARCVIAHAEQVLRDQGRDAQPVLGRLRGQLRQLVARRVCE
jgi:hypothetical protein